ncbi:MAG: protein kinase [Alphaproteobacteria bacterium]|nr:protein kinase [Alphaproteobacteria bacterium]
MITCPTALELQTAVDAFDRLADGPADARGAFLARVADNARALLQREAALGGAGEAGEQARLAALLGVEGEVSDLNRRLCQAIQSGAIGPRDPALLAHLRATAIARIAIDQPTYCGLEALLDA